MEGLDMKVQVLEQINKELEEKNIGYIKQIADLKQELGEANRSIDFWVEQDKQGILESVDLEEKMDQIGVAVDALLKDKEELEELVEDLSTEISELQEKNYNMEGENVALIEVIKHLIGRI